jgi:hypothetical protein
VVGSKAWMEQISVSTVVTNKRHPGVLHGNQVSITDDIVKCGVVSGTS